ncbi:serine hydrolase, partial [bacterium]|nr:serine hydrolase [bacterium]
MMRNISFVITAIFFTSIFAFAESEFPGKQWPTAKPSEVGMDEALLNQAKDYALTGQGSGYIIRHGKLVMQWGDPGQKYDLKSSTKSFGATALAVALKDGKINLDDKAIKYQPDLGVPPEENKITGWLDEITIRHLATQTAGFEKPGGYEPLLFKPGTQWHYSDGGPNWLAECLTLIYQRDLSDFMFERVFTPIGIT